MPTRSQVALVLIGTMAMAMTTAGCARKPGGGDGGTHPRYSRAKLVVVRNPLGEPVQFATTVEDPAAIDRLESFFPGMGRPRLSFVARFWMPRVTIHFQKHDGSELTVRSDYKAWTDGKSTGDARVRGELADYVESLRNKCGDGGAAADVPDVRPPRGERPRPPAQ